MSHVEEGSLQAYLDGEIDGAAEAGLLDHVASCTVCAGELEVLRAADERARGALALLEAPAAPAMLRARAAIAAERRGRVRPRRALSLGAGGLARAAMLLLVLAGAGAAAIPDVRRALESTLARVAELFGAREPRIVVPEAPVAPDAGVAPLETRSAFVRPVAGRVRVILPVPAEGRVEVHVRLVDAATAQVEAATEDGAVRFVSSTGRVEVMGVRSGTVTIAIPRRVDNASVEIGDVQVIKEGDELVLAGPARAERGSELRFTIGS